MPILFVGASIAHIMLPPISYDTDVRMLLCGEAHRYTASSILRDRYLLHRYVAIIRSTVPVDMDLLVPGSREPSAALDSLPLEDIG